MNRRIRARVERGFITKYVSGFSFLVSGWFKREWYV